MTLEQEILIKENKAREEGRAEGRAEERERSEHEKRDAARKLKEAGVAPEIIAASLGLPMDEISLD